MKREIKFRAWDKEANRMGWVTLINYTHEGEVYEIIVDYLHAEIDDSFNITLSPDNCELLQFTGFHDKNGKEIYDGDIIKSRLYPLYDGHTHDVYFKDGDYRVRWTMFRLSEMFEHTHTGIEVIGNIYENPELLKA